MLMPDSLALQRLMEPAPITMGRSRSAALLPGTTFQIFLPWTETKAPLGEATADGMLIEGTATILLVNDEEMNLAVGQAILEKLR